MVDRRETARSIILGLGRGARAAARGAVAGARLTRGIALKGRGGNGGPTPLSDFVGLKGKRSMLPEERQIHQKRLNQERMELNDNAKELKRLKREEAGAKRRKNTETVRRLLRGGAVTRGNRRFPSRPVISPKGLFGKPKRDGRDIIRNLLTATRRK